MHFLWPLCSATAPIIWHSAATWTQFCIQRSTAQTDTQLKNHRQSLLLQRHHMPLPRVCPWICWLISPSTNLHPPSSSLSHHHQISLRLKTANCWSEVDLAAISPTCTSNNLTPPAPPRVSLSCLCKWSHKHTCQEWLCILAVDENQQRSSSSPNLREDAAFGRARWEDGKGVKGCCCFLLWNLP